MNLTRCGRINPAEPNFSLVTNEQLLLMIGIPMAGNALLFGILIAFLDAKFKAFDLRFERILDARPKQIEEGRR